jgi:hypothetical protein
VIARFDCSFTTGGYSSTATGSAGAEGKASLDEHATIEAVIPHFTPLVPTLVREPFHRPGWVFEEKVDGWRILAPNGFRERRVVQLG